MKIIAHRAGMIRLRAGQPRNCGSIPGKCETVFFTASRPALGLTQHPVQWIPEVFSSGINRAGHETGQNVHQVKSLKMRGALSTFPHTSS
jgi:hypothetical protein